MFAPWIVCPLLVCGGFPLESSTIADAVAANVISTHPALLPPAVLVGVAGGGGGGVSHAPSGGFIGADTGVATLLPSNRDAAEVGWAFGFRGGYQWRSGIALQVRFDDLGVNAPGGGGGPLLLATAGVRYSLPLALMPFAEVLVGPTFYGSQVTPGAALGLGVSLPVLRHLAFDLSVRDWLADLGGSVCNTPTVELGATVIFGGR